MIKVIKFFKDVKQEMGYITWPSRGDLKEGTTVVIVMSAIVAIFLAIVDTIFSFGIRQILFNI